MIRPTARTLSLAVTASLLAMPLVFAVKRQVHRDVRAAYEGMTLRLRVDLRPATVATVTNVITAEGVGYAREEAPVLFNRLQTVYIDRVTNAGSRRIDLTVYRSVDDAKRNRALAIPPPSLANPNAAGTLAAFAQLDSTSITLEVESQRKEPLRQRQEVETLLARLFYIDSEPTRQELEAAVLRHRGASMQQLRALTGLETKEIRAILDRAAP